MPGDRAAESAPHRRHGRLGRGVYAKDVILEIIRRLGVKGGVGYAYEYAGDTIERMSMDERMTICNMSIEGGARVGYVNPDQTTFDYLRGRQFAPQGDAFERATAWWSSMASDPDAAYDDEVVLDAAAIRPTVTWGINPGQSVARRRDAARETRDPEGARVHGLPRRPAGQGHEDRRRVRRLVHQRAAVRSARSRARSFGGQHVAPHVKALVVPGSQAVRAAAEREGLDRVFLEAGFEWRGAGCSMCLAMNPDRLEGREICASSSNRNFKGRQGSPTGRTLLMSPAMVAAAAVAGEVVDVRECRRRRWRLAVERVREIRGTALPLRGDDIDTDRIIPARFLKSITFDGLEEHLFEDDRQQAASRGHLHAVAIPPIAARA